MHFKNFFEEFNHRVAKSDGRKANILEPNKTWVDRASEFDNRLVAPWFQDHDIEIYLTHDEERRKICCCRKNYY